MSSWVHHLAARRSRLRYPRVFGLSAVFRGCAHPGSRAADLFCLRYRFFLAALFYPEAFEVFALRRLWLFAGILVVSMTLLFGQGDWVIGKMTLSREGFSVGLEMALRALTIVVAVAGFAARVSVSELAGLMERSGLKGLGFAFGVAFNVLPMVRATATNAYQAIRMRGGFRRHRFKAMRLLLITVITNSLRQADDIVTAAEARAFSPNRARPLSIARRRGDFALAGALLAAMILLVV